MLTRNNMYSKLARCEAADLPRSRRRRSFSTSMSILHHAPSLAKAGIPLAFQWPVKFCLSTTAATYVLSLVTGNVSQVDRLWTFLPVIYSAYYALLPFWPAVPPLPLLPYVPEGLHRTLVNEGNSRTALMFTLQVSSRVHKSQCALYVLRC